jgi:hypothetical protein
MHMYIYIYRWFYMLIKPVIMLQTVFITSYSFVSLINLIFYYYILIVQSGGLQCVISTHIYSVL